MLGHGESQKQGKIISRIQLCGVAGRRSVPTVVPHLLESHTMCSPAQYPSRANFNVHCILRFAARADKERVLAL
jgi:hypothetical protein